MLKPNMTPQDWDEHYKEVLAKYTMKAIENIVKKEQEAQTKTA